MEDKLKKFLTGTFKYDRDGLFIVLENADGYEQRILELRGYGAMQNLFKGGQGQVDISETNKFQDMVGEKIAEMLNAQTVRSKPNAEIIWSEENNKMYGLDVSFKKGIYKDFTFDIRYDHAGTDKKPDCGLILSIWFKAHKVGFEMSDNIQTLIDHAESYMKEFSLKY